MPEQKLANTEDKELALKDARPSRYAFSYTPPKYDDEYFAAMDKLYDNEL